MLGQLSPLFVCYSFLIDLSEAGLPRMTSTALRWTPKRHPFTCPQHPTHQNNPTNGSKVRRGSIFSSSALPHFQPIRCSKWRFNLLSEGVNTFYEQTSGSKSTYLLHSCVVPEHLKYVQVFSIIPLAESDDSTMVFHRHQSEIRLKTLRHIKIDLSSSPESQHLSL